MPDNAPERDDDGQFTPRVPDEGILGVVRDLVPAGAVDIGDAVGLPRQNARYHLHRLTEAGRVARQIIGPTLVWSIADGSSTEEGGES